MATGIAKLLTEDLGKTLEYAICLLAHTPFHGTFKYSVTEAETLRDRLRGSEAMFAGFKHTGHVSNLYDFTRPDSGSHLSVKTIKNSKTAWKVCPQELGQPTKRRFCIGFGISEDLDLEAIKKYIETNILQLLPIYLEKTFHCPVLLYCKPLNKMLLIQQKAPIDFSTTTLRFRHQEIGSQWKESATLYICPSDGKKKALGEFQIHTHRDCIKFRWDLNTILKFFPEAFDVKEL